jgi:hypothetical protein
MGATGPAGPTGATGPAGPAGPTGASGPAGATGPAGASGPAGPTGATGPAGPTGATGATGATGPAGSTFILGGSGSSVAAGPTVVFTGISDQSATEANVQQIVGSGLTFGHFYCYGPKPTGSTSDVFTLRVNGAATAATCTVAKPNTTGTNVVSVSVSAGDLVDVQVVNGSAAGQVSWALAP